jgi:hypothetical protein
MNTSFFNSKRHQRPLFLTYIIALDFYNRVKGNEYTIALKHKYIDPLSYVFEIMPPR